MLGLEHVLAHWQEVGNSECDPERGGMASGSAHRGDGLIPPMTYFLSYLLVSRGWEGMEGMTLLLKVREGSKDSPGPLRNRSEPRKMQTTETIQVVGSRLQKWGAHLVVTTGR